MYALSSLMHVYVHVDIVSEVITIISMVFCLTGWRGDSNSEIPPPPSPLPLEVLGKFSNGRVISKQLFADTA